MEIRLTKDIRQEIVDMWGFEDGQGWGIGLIPGAVVRVENPNDEGGFYVKDARGEQVNVMAGEYVLVTES